MRRSPLILMAALALALSACGVRGQLEPPSQADVPEGGQPAPAPEEDRPFILDGLLL